MNLYKSIRHCTTLVFPLFRRKITAPQLTCDTNMPTRCKRGDLIHCIEMGFVGSWGEGITTDYSEYSSSTPLIHIAELYKNICPIIC